MKPDRRRFERSWDHAKFEEHEPDGDGTALITRDDVVRLHGALRNDDE